jgi:hypothetical protein
MIEGRNGMKRGTRMEDPAIIEADSLSGLQLDIEAKLELIEERHERAQALEDLINRVGALEEERKRGLEGGRIVDGDEMVEEFVGATEQSVDRRLRLQLDRRMGIERLVVRVLVFEPNHRPRQNPETLRIPHQ